MSSISKHDKGIFALHANIEGSTVHDSQMTAHRLAVMLPISEIVKRLIELLSRTLTAYIAGVKDTKTIARWADGTSTDMRVLSHRQLRAAFEITELLKTYDSPEVVRAWFIGNNPILGTAPAEAIREGRIREAQAAAIAFISGVGLSAPSQASRTRDSDSVEP